MHKELKSMDLNFKNIFTAFMILFAVIDIVGNIPIIIDLRKNSTTYLQHQSFNLSEINYTGLYVPKGFAHGFITLAEDVLASYLVSSNYDSKSERAIRWNDPLFNINWSTSSPVLSEKDSNLANFNSIKNGLNNNYIDSD